MIHRLALVTETFPPDVNGVAMTLNRLSSHLRERGVDLEVVRPKSRGNSDWGLRGDWKIVEVRGFPIPGYPEAQIGMPSLGRLKKLWKACPPDVVHVATEGMLGWTAAQAATSLKLPLITSFHTNFHEYTRHYRLSWMKSLVIRYLRGIHGKAEINLVPDRDLIAELYRLGFQKCAYFGRGVDTELFSPVRRSLELRKSWGASEKTPVFLHVSRVAAEKNIPLVLDTFRDFKRINGGNACCVVVGDGPERKSLEKKYPEIIFTGMKFDEELAAHYASADLFCFASETETFGNVILEAMASGCAVVTYDYAAGRQYVDSGINGILVPFGDAGTFRRRMMEAGSERERCREMGEKARETAGKVPWSTVIDGYLSVLADVLETRNGNLKTED